MIPAMDTALGVKIPTAAPGVGMGEDAEPDEAPVESDEVESWLLIPPVLEESVPVSVAAFELSVVADVPIVVVVAGGLEVVVVSEQEWTRSRTSNQRIRYKYILVFIHNIHTVTIIVNICILLTVIIVVLSDIVVEPVSLILGDAGRAERDLSFGSVPIANALYFSCIPFVLGITALGDSDNRAAGRPAAIGDVVVVEFRCDGNAGKEEATKRE